MANSKCSKWGKPANQDYSLNGTIPSGAACAFTGFHQSWNAHSIDVLADGQKVGGISNPSSRSGAAQVMSGSVFNIDQEDLEYSLRFNDAGIHARVMVAEQRTAWGKHTLGGTWILALEDDTQNVGDCDFNDVVGFLSWTMKKG